MATLQSTKDDEVAASGGNLDNSNLPQNKLSYVTHWRETATENKNKRARGVANQKL